MRQSDWSSALYKALEHAQRTLQTKIEGLHVQRSRLGAHDDLIEVTKKNVTEESQQLQTELKAKIGEVRRAPRAARGGAGGLRALAPDDVDTFAWCLLRGSLQLRKVLDKYESDMVELVKRDEQWMLQTLQQHKEEAATYMDRTDSSLRTLRDETAGQTTARDVVERMEKDVDTLTENLTRLPVRRPAPEADYCARRRQRRRKPDGVGLALRAMLCIRSREAERVVGAGRS